MLNILIELRVSRNGAETQVRGGGGGWKPTEMIHSLAAFQSATNQNLLMSNDAFEYLHVRQGQPLQFPTKIPSSIPLFLWAFLSRKFVIRIVIIGGGIQGK